MKNKKQVFVALSGGVDSAVAALILLEQGFQVTGIFMETWRDPQNRSALEGLSTTRTLASEVAEFIGIPFVVVDARETFYQKVIKSFIDQYALGETPNPCLFCNPQIKWGILQNYALAHGAEFFATGHYARIQNLNGEPVELKRGVDRNKDQSYVLAMLSQNQLKNTLLPLGDLTKDKVRDIARSKDLHLSDNRESQDLCFLDGENYRDFLNRYAPESTQKGEIVNLTGEVLGEHEGLPFYTIGQRKGIKIAASEPYYVIRKDADKNRLVVGFASQATSSCLHAIKANWIAGVPPLTGEGYQVMIRYRTKPVFCELTYSSEDEFNLNFDIPLQGVTSGQVAVIYRDEICLGGGMIKKTADAYK